MMQATYAKAIDRLIATGVREETLADNLITHLKGRGRLKLLPGILAELRSYEAQRKAVAPKVEVAHEKDSAAARTRAASAGIDAKKVVVNHSLISGWRAQSKGTLIDHSGKRALLDLYRSIAQ